MLIARLKFIHVFFVFSCVLMITGANAFADMAEVRQAMKEGRNFAAFEELQDLAKEGNKDAQFELGGFYHYGRISAANFDKAFYWYNRAANQGSVDAMIGLSVLYGHGQGVEKNPETAYRWLATAKRQSLPPEIDAKLSKALTDLDTTLSAAQIEAAQSAANAFTAKAE